MKCNVTTLLTELAEALKNWSGRLVYRNYALHSRTIFSNFSLFDATIFQERLSFKGGYLIKNPFFKIKI